MSTAKIAARGLLVAVLALVALAACAPEGGVVRGRRMDVHCFAAVCRYQPQLWISDSSSSSWPYTDRPAAGWTDVSDRTYRTCREGDRYPDCAN
jgi:hypothetical protein